MADYERRCCIHGYHIYQEIWSSSIGEVLPCEREPLNDPDRYAVAVIKDGVVGHVPRKFSRMCSLFLGVVYCKVTGERRYSIDLPQGRLEVPCKLLFAGKLKDIKDLKSLFERRCSHRQQRQ